MAISKSFTKDVYINGKKIYEGSINRKQAIEQLQKKYKSVAATSKEFYITAFLNMMEGKAYKRTINAESAEYYLNKIYDDFGSSKLQSALTAFEAHIDYYEKQSNSTSHTNRAIHDRHLKRLNAHETIAYPDEIPEPDNIYEGAKKKVTVNVYERNPEARRICIDHYKCICSVCDFSFEKVYGAIGKDFIHVHHIKLLSKIKKGYKVNPVKDLRPVCPNCHSMIHRKNPPYTIEELKKRIK